MNLELAPGSTLDNQIFLDVSLYDKFGKDVLVFKMRPHNLKAIENIDSLSPFYKGILNSWIQMDNNDKNQLNCRDIRQQVIWGKKYIITIL